jgi:Protein of unknown function (DUF4239)
MRFIDQPWALFVVSFTVLLVTVESGFRLRQKTAADIDDSVQELIVAARGAISVLLSLLLGFSLAMAAARYDLRRQLVVDEANAIRTTALRAQMLDEPASSRIRQLLPEYARLNFAAAGLYGAEMGAALDRTQQLQKELWQEAVAAARQRPSPITSVFAQSLNQAIDVSENRLAALEKRVPAPVWLLLGLLSLFNCLIFGASARRRFWFAMLVSPLMISIVLSLIADVDSPHGGLIRISQESMDRVRQDLKGGIVRPD